MKNIQATTIQQAFTELNAVPSYVERFVGDEEYTGVLNTDGTHSDEYPFCSDMSCDCHEDPGEIANTADDVENGLMTTSEADRYYRGKTI